MARITTFCFTARPTADQEHAMARHVGARRFAYNQCLRLMLDAADQKRTDPSVEVLRTPFSLINAFNAWKRSEEAGRRFVVGADGAVAMIPGLPWRNQVCAQVFEEAAVDLGRARARSDVARATKTRVGFPHFQRKGRCTESFRVRNKRSKNGTPSISVGRAGPRSITLPVLGPIRVREDTRRLRRLLRCGSQGPRARICHVTVKLKHRRVLLCVAVEAPDLHDQLRHHGSEHGFVGVDLGLTNALVAARADGTEVARVAPRRALERSLRKLRRASRTASRRKPGSNNRRKANDRLRVINARVAHQRKDVLHTTSSRLVKTHDRLCLEDLAVQHLVRNRHLARHIADAGWGTFRQMVTYKASWYGTALKLAPRWFASTKTCSACGWRWDDMTLCDRVFRCQRCGLVLDRDTNAAANLAAWADAEVSSASQAPDPEARGRVTNACGGTSAGHHFGGGETGPATAGRLPGEEARTGAAR